MKDEEIDGERFEFYRHYSAHKGWLQRTSVDHVDRFTNIFQRLRVPASASVLEIGFGAGNFLEWAKEQQYQAEGVEILPEMVEHARTNGHLVHLGDVGQLDFSGRRFDLLAAFDVIEHFSMSEVAVLFQTAGRLLKPNGRIVVQFPNASSPFSAPYQNGDVTHRLYLSKDSLEQIARPNGWTVVDYFNARARSKHPLRQMKMLVTYCLRDLIELVISFAYFGHRYPLDPNLVVVLERAKEDRDLN